VSSVSPRVISTSSREDLDAIGIADLPRWNNWCQITSQAQIWPSTLATRRVGMNGGTGFEREGKRDPDVAHAEGVDKGAGGKKPQRSNRRVFVRPRTDGGSQLAEAQHRLNVTRGGHAARRNGVLVRLARGL